MKEPRFSEEGSLDRFENKLFNPKTKISDVLPRHGIHEVGTRDEIPTSWGDGSTIISAKKESVRSLGFKMLVFSLVILLVTVIFASWNIWQKRNVISESNIDIVIDVKPFVEGGEESPVTIAVQNRNNVSLLDTNLIISYEKGVGGQDQMEKVSNKIKFGDIKQNEIKNEDEIIQLYGSEGESRVISVVLDYKIAGSNAIYTKEVTKNVILKTPPVSVHIEGPDHVASLQSSKYIIKVKNNSSKVSDNILVNVTFPSSFTISSASPEIKSRNINAWILQPLEQGEEKNIIIEGSAKASVGEHLSIKANVGSQNNNSYDMGTVYSFDLKDITISDSDLKFTVNIENNSGKVEFFRFGDKIKLSLGYENISGRALDSVEIKGVISGNSFDPNTVASQNGEYSLNNKTVLWNKFTAPELTNLEVGAKGVLVTTFDVLKNGNDKSFVRFDAQGSSLGADSNTRDIKTNISRTWQVQGETSLTSQTFYVGTSFLNAGPVPPRVGAPTTYTLRMSVSSHNSLKKGSVTFNLPSYVTWLNKVNANDTVTYASSTRTVTWDVSNLYGGSSKTLEVQVMITPTQSHLGNTPALTSGIKFISQETLGESNSVTNKPLTTILSDEESSNDKWMVIDK